MRRRRDRLDQWAKSSSASTSAPRARRASSSARTARRSPTLEPTTPCPCHARVGRNRTPTPSGGPMCAPSLGGSSTSCPEAIGSSDRDECHRSDPAAAGRVRGAAAQGDPVRRRRARSTGWWTDVVARRSGRLVGARGLDPAEPTYIAGRSPHEVAAQVLDQLPRSTGAISLRQLTSAGAHPARRSRHPDQAGGNPLRRTRCRTGSGLRRCTSLAHRWPRRCRPAGCCTGRATQIRLGPAILGRRSRVDEGVQYT